jgi:O-methyltransferase involved in polyketide biosynthesis
LVVSLRISGISETLLIPLWARVQETDRPDAIIRDKRAKAIVSQLDYDFTEFEKARLSQLGVSIRTMLLDRAVTAFIHHNPSGIVAFARLSPAWYNGEHLGVLWG